MKFEPTQVYHVYNRGNNRQNIFFNETNYQYFIRKMKRELLGDCDILCYCLMPNHFHLLLRPSERGCFVNSDDHKFIQSLSYKLGGLQSSYTRAINKQNNITGSLFQQKIKVKPVETDYWPGANGIDICMHYIHQNPIRAGLVGKMEDWNYSSFQDFAQMRQGTLCNRQLAMELADLDMQSFMSDSYAVVSDNVWDKIA